VIDYSLYPAEIQALLKSANAEIKDAMYKLSIGAIDVNEWVAIMRRILAKSQSLAYLAGVGATSFIPEQLQIVARNIARQFPFLRRFARVLQNEIDAGNIDSIIEKFSRRAELYTQTITSNYWQGRGYGKPAPPAYPGDGTSQCLTQCRCRLEYEELDRDKGDWNIYWRLGEAEHCQTCRTRAREWSPLRYRGGRLILPGQRYLSPEAAAEGTGVRFGRQLQKEKEIADIISRYTGTDR